MLLTSYDLCRLLTAGKDLKLEARAHCVVKNVLMDTGSNFVPDKTRGFSAVTSLRTFERARLVLQILPLGQPPPKPTLREFLSQIISFLVPGASRLRILCSPSHISHLLFISLWGSAGCGNFALQMEQPLVWRMLKLPGARFSRRQGRQEADVGGHPNRWEMMAWLVMGIPRTAPSGVLRFCIPD